MFATGNNVKGGNNCFICVENTKIYLIKHEHISISDVITDSTVQGKYVLFVRKNTMQFTRHKNGF
jgi:hypothetical protein